MEFINLSEKSRYMYGGHKRNSNDVANSLGYKTYRPGKRFASKTGRVVFCVGINIMKKANLIARDRMSILKSTDNKIGILRKIDPTDIMNGNRLHHSGSRYCCELITAYTEDFTKSKGAEIVTLKNVIIRYQEIEFDWYNDN